MKESSFLFFRCSAEGEWLFFSFSFPFIFFFFFPEWEDADFQTLWLSCYLFSLLYLFIFNLWYWIEILFHYCCVNLHEWDKFLGGSRSTSYPRAKIGNSDEPSEEAGSVCASAWTEEAIYTFQLVGVGPLLKPI